MPPKSKSAAAVTTVPILVLEQKGDVTQKKLSCAGDGTVTLANIQAFTKKKHPVELIGTYPYKTLTLFLFGVSAGKEDQENQHQLPPPHDTSPLYGDAYLLASKDEASYAQPVPFKPDEYEQFYTRAFGGFDSDDEEEDITEGPVDTGLDAEGGEEGKEFAQDEGDEEDEGAENDTEDEDEEENEEEGAEECGEDGDEDIIPVVSKVKAKKRKMATKSSSTAAQTSTSAYPERPTLSEAQQLQEEPFTENDALPESKSRLQVLKSLTQLFRSKLTAHQIIQLERAIYNSSLREAVRRHVVRSWEYPLFAHLYRMIARHIASNFDTDSYVKNIDFFEKFQQGDLPLSAIPGLTHYEIFPSRWKEQFEQQQVREKSQLEGNRAMATDQFLCTRCWKRECTYYEMQTRSADEPMTIFITCVNCGKHWRQ